MNNEEALEKLKEMPDREFNTFLENLPYRVQLLVKARFVNWQEVLPQWYLKQAEIK